MIRFACPSCGKHLKAEDRGAGRKISCPRCGQRLQVPGPFHSHTTTVLGQPLPEAPAATDTTAGAGQVLITCPGCSGGLLIAPESLGRWVECPTCGTGFAASGDPPPAAGLSTSAALPDAYSPPTRRPPGTRLALLVVGGLSILALAVFFVVVIVASQGGPAGKTAASAGANNRPAAPPPSAAPPRPATDPAPAEAADEIGAALVGWGFMGTLCFLGLGYLVGYVLLLAWVARDCRNRGVDGGAVWILVILFLHFIGLLVYLASRPHGMLAVCGTCGNKRLVHAKACPHCGHA